MDPLHELLDCCGAKVALKQNREGFLKAHCPFAPWDHQSGTDNNPSFEINLDQPHGYYCWSCGAWGKSPTSLVQDLVARNKGQLFGPDVSPKVKLYAQRAFEIAYELEENQELNLDTEQSYEDHLMKPGPEAVFDETWLNSFMPAYGDGGVHPYLEGRAVPYSVAVEFDIRFDSSKQRICIPVRDFDGVLRGLHGRDITATSELPYLMYPYQGSTNPMVWLGEDKLDVTAPLLVVESVFDVLRAYEVYPNVAAPLTAMISRKKAERMFWANQIVTLLDDDKAGTRARRRLSKYCKESYITHLLPPVGAKDPGEMTKNQIKDILLSTLPSSILAGCN